MWFGDPTTIPAGVVTRTVSFENPTGAPGAAGSAAGGRKGAPQRSLDRGERVVLVDLDGPGRVGHFWMTVPPMRPEHLREVVVEVFYDGSAEPSISVPAADLRCAVRPAGAVSLRGTAEHPGGPGLQLVIPMPFRRHVRIELLNASRPPVFCLLPGRRDARSGRRRPRNPPRLVLPGEPDERCAATSRSPRAFAAPAGSSGATWACVYCANRPG